MFGYLPINQAKLKMISAYVFLFFGVKAKYIFWAAYGGPKYIYTKIIYIRLSFNPKNKRIQQK